MRLCLFKANPHSSLQFLSYDKVTITAFNSRKKQTEQILYVEMLGMECCINYCINNIIHYN